jgi:SagB-type dehydrogenase family enzyme
LQSENRLVTFITCFPDGILVPCKWGWSWIRIYEGDRIIDKGFSADNASDKRLILWVRLKMNKNAFLCKSILVSLLSLSWLSACNPGDQWAATASHTGTPSPDLIQLPTPRSKGTLTLEEALSERRSVRAFNEIPLTLEELGQLLWAAQGITDPAGYRTAPSAGALYPLEVYVITREGAYHYDPPGHRLDMHQPGDLRPALHAAALRQDAVLDAPAVFVIATVYERTEKKYGQERTPRYVHLEAGHAAQNLLLQATALDLGAVPVGAFSDGGVKKALSLPDDQQPLYLIPVGHPER